MLGLSFINFSLSCLPFIISVTTCWLLVVDYLFFLKKFLFKKLKNKKKTTPNESTIVVPFFILLPTLWITNVLLLTKYHNIFSQFNNDSFSFNSMAIGFYVFSSVLISLIYLYFIHFYFNDYSTINYNSFIPLPFSVLVFYLASSTNLVIFFLLIEIFSYIFYFQFFQFFKKKKVKSRLFFLLDSFLLYYWLNFLGSILLLYSVLCLLKEFNTLSFFELSLLAACNKGMILFCFFFFLGLIIKIGATGFHFLKVEIYKNLKVDALINFSFLSLFFYVLIIKLMLTHFNYLILFLNFYLLFFIFFFGFLLLIPFAFNLNNIVLFFGYSTVLTSNLLLLFIL